MKDSDFINQFVAVLAILVGIAVLIFIIANAVSEDYAMVEAERKIVEQRILPVGKVYVGEVPPALSTDAPKTEALSPKMVYERVCAVCHAAGLLNAPVYGDAAAWGPRKQNLKQMYQSAINGKGTMPAKGGDTSLSDDMVRKVVDYILEGS